ncbi:MAG: DUF4838 domain-containing protein, partial [Bacteroidota bacterium]
MSDHPFGHSSKNAYEHVLVRGREAQYDILIADRPEAGVEHAAKLLQAELKKLSNCSFPIVREARRGRGIISIGNTSSTHQLDNLTPDLGQEGYELISSTRAIYLRAAHPMGQVNGVLAFLEEDLGVRWWGNQTNQTYYPQKSPLAVKIASRSSKPAFEYREPYYSAIRGKHYIDHNRLRSSRGVARIASEPWQPYKLYPSGYEKHTFLNFVPGSEFGKSNPEFYSERNGTRIVPN